MEREVGGGIEMWNTCKPMAVSFQCMTKSTTIKKIIRIIKRKDGYGIGGELPSIECPMHNMLCMTPNIFLCFAPQNNCLHFIN